MRIVSAIMSSNRCPYTTPLYEGDVQFMGPCDVKKPEKICRDHPNSPWQRLVRTSTCSKRLKEVDYCGPEVPQDKLDFSLKSEYDHHREAFKDNNEKCIQRETIIKAMGYQPCCGGFRCKWNQSCNSMASNYPRIVSLGEKLSPFSVKTVISSHHTQTSNNGYTRKPDGGFYSS